MLKLNRSNTSKKGKKKGQSTVEYILLAAAVIAALVTFLGPKGMFTTQLNSVLNTVVQDMDDMANKLGSSHGSGNNAT